MEAHATRTPRSLLVTGGAGFIGSNYLHWLEHQDKRPKKIIVLDALTYAGNLENIQDLIDSNVIEFVQGDIGDQNLLNRLLNLHQIDALINFAAETHVDRSISGPSPFVTTNINGTFNLINCVSQYLSEQSEVNFAFVQVSTDEVYGSLGDTGLFSETSRYCPSSPYSASKAAADHLVQAWHCTYGFPGIVTHCSNNYGPRQFPEKFIPVVISRALAGEAIPIYGTGANIRDWIHVDDHAAGVHLALTKGKFGESYCFGGAAEENNLSLATKICLKLDVHQPRLDKISYTEQLEFVEDRKGHDFRYAIDSSKAERELNFKRIYNFASGLEHTIQWYLNELLPTRIHADFTSNAQDMDNQSA